jgi:SAM-dependent methyltransferase
MAVEPSRSMRIECRSVAAGVAVLGGSAEAIPLVGGCGDVLTVAQAFHWFDPRRALHEMARVLRPDGVVALAWNERDQSAGWVAQLDAIMRRAGEPPHGPAEAIRPSFDGDAHFTPFTRWQGAHHVSVQPEQVEDMVASRSYMRVLGEAERSAVLADVRRLAAPLGAPITVPYVTSAYCARALPSRCACDDEFDQKEKVSWSG